jgi:hypothetical protein
MPPQRPVLSKLRLPYPLLSLRPSSYCIPSFSVPSEAILTNELYLTWSTDCYSKTQDSM